MILYRDKNNYDITQFNYLFNQLNYKVNAEITKGFEK